MDVYASLLAQLQMKKELEALATKLMGLNPMCSECLLPTAIWPNCSTGSQKHYSSPTELLPSLLKRLKEADSHLQQALLNDSTNINVYETFVRSLVLQKRLQDAQRMTKNALNALGEDNPRIKFLNGPSTVRGLQFTLGCHISIR
uniref:Uncharacterized protein n=1 Tax=Ditylenchus dipsaci TaxID=166011 RepID=A0A915CU84_9BILA